MQFHLSVMQERKFKEKRETKIKALMKIKTCNKWKVIAQQQSTDGSYVLVMLRIL